MRLTNTELKNARTSFSNWLSPADMKSLFKEINYKLGGSDFFNQAGLAFLRESYIISEFGIKRNASAVRLITESRPDAMLRLHDGEIENYEIIEADIPSRERGKEYKNDNKETFINPDELATPELAFNIINRAVSIKAAKALKLKNATTPYPSGTNLLIYLNLLDFGFHKTGVEKILSDAIGPARDWFSAIWILWNEEIYKVH